MPSQNPHPLMPSFPLPPSSPNDASQSSNISRTGNQSGDSLLQELFPSSYTFVIIPSENLLEIPAAMGDLAYAILRCLSHLHTACQVCYFLGQRRPILVVVTHPRGGSWESYDYHKNEAERYPWRLLHPSTSYESFSTKVHASLRHSNAGGGGCDRYVICGEPRRMTEYHESCFYGQGLFMLAFMIWKDRSTRDRVFSFIYTHINIPNFPSREEYAEWLGSSTFSAWATLNYIHLVIVAYDILRRARVLPRSVFHLSISLR
jgi:hypothetical protein